MSKAFAYSTNKSFRVLQVKSHPTEYHVQLQLLPCCAIYILRSLVTVENVTVSETEILL